MSARLALLIAAGLLPGHAIAQSFVTLAREHVDVLVMDRPGTDPRLGIALRNGDTGAVLDPATTVLEVGEAGRLEVPPGLEIFGPAGSSLWVLPQSQDTALPYLGISASGISQAAWQPRFDIQLLRVEGPGHFFAWQFDPFSGLEMRMNSRDGIGPDDVLSPLLGGHEHVNWGFTATGLHRVELKVSGRFAGSTNVMSSDSVTLLFGVTPYSLPAAPAVLSAPRHAGDRFACRLLGSPARSYRVEASANLLEWTTVATVTTDASGAAGVDAPGTGGARFYRATSAP